MSARRFVVWRVRTADVPAATSALHSVDGVSIDDDDGPDHGWFPGDGGSFEDAPLASMRDHARENPPPVGWTDLRCATEVRPGRSMDLNQAEVAAMGTARTTAGIAHREARPRCDPRRRLTATIAFESVAVVRTHAAPFRTSMAQALNCSPVHFVVAASAVMCVCSRSNATSQRQPDDPPQPVNDTSSSVERLVTE